LLCPVGAWLARRERGVRTLFFGSLALMLAYAPFYFDGSYPGGGARFFADVLPLEHVLLAIALVRLNWTALALPFSLVGFALHASFSHRSLAERDYGRPEFDPSVLASAGIDHGLVLVETDEGFNLGHVPGDRDAAHHVIVARSHRDAHDRALWLSLGRPPMYVYATHAFAGSFVTDTYERDPADLSSRFEAEAEWPPLAVWGGWGEPVYFGCGHYDSRGLRLHPVGGGPGVGLKLELDSPDDVAGPRHLRVRWLRDAGPATVLRLSGPGFDHAATVPEGSTDCVFADFENVPLFPSAPNPTKAIDVRFQASRPGILDYIEVLPGGQP
jgi:hypothetical protein